MYYYEIIGFGSCTWCQRANQLASQECLPFVASWIENSPDLLEWHKTNYGMETVPIVLKLNTESDEINVIGGYTEFKEHIDAQLHRRRY